MGPIDATPQLGIGRGLQRGKLRNADFRSHCGKPARFSISNTNQGCSAVRTKDRPFLHWLTTAIAGIFHSFQKYRRRPGVARSQSTSDGAASFDADSSGLYAFITFAMPSAANISAASAARAGRRRRRGGSRRRSRRSASARAAMETAAATTAPHRQRWRSRCRACSARAASTEP